MSRIASRTPSTPWYVRLPGSSSGGVHSTSGVQSSAITSKSCRLKASKPCSMTSDRLPTRWRLRTAAADRQAEPALPARAAFFADVLVRHDLAAVRLRVEQHLLAQA